MLDVDSDDLTSSIASFMKNYTALDLLNHGLQDQSLMEEFLSKNGVQIISSKLPGVIVQVYLLVAKKFGFDVFGPITGEIRETLNDNLLFDIESNIKQDVVEIPPTRPLPALVPLETIPDDVKRREFIGLKRKFPSVELCQEISTTQSFEVPLTPK